MESHRIEDTSHDFDLIVVGGGLAGLCAAIAAARHGTRTAIIQDRPVFGGNASSEIRVVPHGAGHSNAWTGETGIVMEKIHEDRAHNHVHFFDHGMTNSLFDLTLLEFVRREPNLTPFLNTTIRAVLLDPGAMRTRMRAEAMPGEDPLSLPEPAEIGPLIVELAQADLGLPKETISFAAWKAAGRVLSA